MTISADRRELGLIFCVRVGAGPYMTCIKCSLLGFGLDLEFLRATYRGRDSVQRSGRMTQICARGRAHARATFAQ